MTLLIFLKAYYLMAYILMRHYIHVDEMYIGDQRKKHYMIISTEVKMTF